ncbi:MAG: DUF3413 domain-containing protein [Gammaproteobacteria bacterium]|jgi:hypothetical protein|nr:DUF3413 domain-containing protein [Gammaproteobacteria bacterium]
MTELRAPRRRLLRWIGWFGVINAGLFALVAQRYLWLYHFPGDGIGIVYAVLTFVGHLTLLAVVPMFIVLLPFVIVLRARRLVMALGVVIAACGLSLLFLDTNVFAEHRFHLGALTASLFEVSTWVFSGILLVIFLAFEAMLAGIVWQNFALADGPRRGRILAVVLLGCWFASQAIHIWGDAVGHTPVTQFTRFMPLYYPIHAKRDLARLGWVDPEMARRQRMLRGSLEAADGQLNYPLKPLKCTAANDDLPNIIIILIDALRPDAIDPKLTPTLATFRADAMYFNQQYSGGNSSRMGLFSMFYGLPSTYWQAFYDLQRAPVLMDEIKARPYDVGLFSAVGFGSPTLIDRTAFAGWPDLTEKRHDMAVTDRNKIITTDWLRWLEQRTHDRPFFGLVYYDPPMKDVALEPGEPLPMDDRFTHNEKARTLWRQYRLAIRMLDSEVQVVLNSLRERNLLDDTIVIVTSDHGYEFDDNGIGHYGHASNFSTVQLRATLMMHWPGKSAGAIDYRTTHHDLPVTLLQEVFGCENPPSDYSVGRNLFSGQSWDWMMAGSYTSHAIVEPGRVIVSHPGGFVEVLGSDYRPVQDKTLNVQLIQDSLEAQRRYLK